jgi:hypothetical protein
MKLLSVALARSVWYLDTGELNPRGKDVFAHLISALIEDYKFNIYPKAGEDFSQGMKLMQGQFVKEDGTVLTVNLTIFTDGIAADTFSSTTDSDDFLSDALGGLPEIGFEYDPSMVRSKAYASQLNVACSKQLGALNPKLNDFATRISSGVSGNPAFGFAAIEFWPDQSQRFKPVSFSFQRRIGDSLSDNRYWSQAPMQTEQHLELLEELETLLS